MEPTARLAQFVELNKNLGRATQAHVGIFVALAIVVLVYFVFKRTRLGYEWRMVGTSSSFSEFGGIKLDRAFISAMLVSGGIAGLGGAVEILGVWRTYKNLFASGFGFRGLLAALLGGQTVIGSTVAALFYGSMEAGALGVDWAAGVPRQLIDILVGLVIFFMAAEGMWAFVQRIKWVRAPGTERRTTKDLEV
ncbi:MAG: ABC transporter permease [Chloroflexi bacterium]|nr:ABC transporter permease [Chloroflexota bacterium]